MTVTVRALPNRCYCETTAKCQVTGSGCTTQPDKNKAAAIFGNSEGNCATPMSLYDSAVAFMGKTEQTDLVYFTGDFAEAGASAPCHGKEVPRGLSLRPLPACPPPRTA